MELLGHRIANESVKQKIRGLIGEYELLLEVACRRKHKWFGHMTKRLGSLAQKIMYVLVDGARGLGRPKRTWITDITEWTGIGIIVCERRWGQKKWRKIYSGVIKGPQWPT